MAWEQYRVRETACTLALDTTGAVNITIANGVFGNAMYNGHASGDRAYPLASYRGAAPFNPYHHLGTGPSTCYFQFPLAGWWEIYGSAWLDGVGTGDFVTMWETKDGVALTGHRHQFIGGTTARLDIPIEPFVITQAQAVEASAGGMSARLSIYNGSGATRTVTDLRLTSRYLGPVA